MTLELQILLFIASLTFFVFMVRIIKKSKLQTDMATAWIIWGLGVILIALIPEIVYNASDLLGIQSPINSLFLFMIFFLYCLVFYLYIKISVLDEKLKNLVQYISLNQNKDKE